MRTVIQPLALLVGLLLPASMAFADAPGGILENINSLAPDPTTGTWSDTRPTLTASQIQAFMPSRGKFTFPAPWNTEAYRITNASDCGGSDCLWGVGYAYWRVMNNSSGSDTMLIMIGLDRNRGGDGPNLYQLNKVTGEVTNLGPLFDSSDPLSYETGEQWYFSYSQPHQLYITYGPQLRRYDVITHKSQVVFDLMAYLKSADPASVDPSLTSLIEGVQAGNTYDVWQTHTSNDDLVHSATVRDATTYAPLGCVAFREDTGAVTFYPAPADGNFDECQIGAGGRWLVVKEDYNNLIVDLSNNTQRILLDKDGAPGHSDMGYGYMVGADNWATQANTFRLWDFSQDPLTNVVVYHNFDWNVAAPDHISFTNARGDVPIDQQYACGSGANATNSPEANEIICFNLNTSGKVLVVAPVMTDPNAPGGIKSYNKAPKGNLDPTGQYFIWTSNMGGSRLDAFVVHIPSQLLDQTWKHLVNLSNNSGTLEKTSGCDGCADASAVTTQKLTGNGFLQFTADDSAPMLMVGLATGDVGTNGIAINYGLRLQSGDAEVREFYVYKADIPFAAGDTFRIGIDDGKVDYYHNGKVFYASDTPPTYPLVGNAVFVNLGSVISNTKMTSTSNVDWRNLVNAAVSDNVLQKIAGCDGCEDGGGVSTRQITTGDGYLSFTANDSSLLRVIGLAHGIVGSKAIDIDYGIRLQAGDAEVREKGGIYRADTSFQPGDTFRIAITDGVVSYLHNGQIFYTSTVPPVYPLSANAVLLNVNSSITDAVINRTLDDNM